MIARMNGDSASSAGPATRTAPPPSLAARALDALGGGIILVALFMMLHGRSRQRYWLAAALALPLLRFAVSAAQRRRVVAWVAARWREIVAYQLALVARDACESAARQPRVPRLAVFALIFTPCLLIYLGSARVPGPGEGDTCPAVPAAARFLLHGDMRLDEHMGRATSLDVRPGEPLPYYLTLTPHGLFSNYPAGMSTLAMPFVAAAQLCGADWMYDRTPGRIEKFAAACIASSCVAMLFLIALRAVDAASAAWLAALLGVGSSIASTVSGDLSQQGGVLFWMLVVLLIESRSAAAQRMPAWCVAVQGVACGMMLTCRISSGAWLACFGVWVLLRAPLRAIAIGLIAAVAFSPWARFYYSTYGSLLGPSAVQLGASEWAGTFGSGLGGVLWSPGRGLFIYHPWLLLALVGVAVSAWRARRSGESRLAACPFMPAFPPGFLVFCAVFIAIHLAVVSSWRMWWGGHSHGPRLLIEVVPLLALLALPAIDRLHRRRAGRGVLVGLLLLSAAMHLPAMYGEALSWNARPLNVDQHPERLWDWRDPPFLRAFAPPLVQ